MAYSINDTKIGYFLQRDDLIHLKAKDVISELHIYLFETTIMLQAINHFREKKFVAFDGTIGDRKCQTRTSMIFDLAHEYNHQNQTLNDIEPLIKNLIANIKTLLNNINNYTQAEHIQLAKDLKVTPLSQYLSKHQILFNAPATLQLISLCYIIALEKNNLEHLVDSVITSRKTKKILNHTAKTFICDLSIEYERNLAKKYNLSEISTSLQQLEKKGFCTMTAFFPSFKPIFEKMKHLQQSFAKKTTHFCRCGGIKKNNFETFSFTNNQWNPVSHENQDPNEAIMIIYGFQFPGSFEQLKQLLQIPQEEISIPKQYHKLCKCNHPFERPSIDNIEHGILANFAHHPQFTTEAEIDFEGLGLIGSNLQKEYDFLKTLSGFSSSDMSKFTINHIYAATLKDAQEQDSPSVLTTVTQHRKDIMSHHDAHCPC